MGATFDGTTLCLLKPTAGVVPTRGLGVHRDGRPQPQLVPATSGGRAEQGAAGCGGHDGFQWHRSVS